jgi:ribosomal protein S6E (S10)|tara:strand:+ start:1158 stop:1784 length:627 start_codon:yes stop_codon:yes gene_type:complete
MGLEIIGDSDRVIEDKIVEEIIEDKLIPIDADLIRDMRREGRSYEATELLRCYYKDLKKTKENAGISFDKQNILIKKAKNLCSNGGCYKPRMVGTKCQNCYNSTMKKCPKCGSDCKKSSKTCFKCTFLPEFKGKYIKKGLKTRAKVRERKIKKVLKKLNKNITYSTSYIKSIIQTELGFTIQGAYGFLRESGIKTHLRKYGGGYYKIK